MLFHSKFKAVIFILPASPNNWYGLGINGGTLIYNVPVNSKHSFQIDGIQEAYTNSSGLTVTDTITSNTLFVTNNITCYSLNVGSGNATVNSFLNVGYGLGIGTNTPLFPLHITGYQSSYQTYKFFNYNGLGGPGGYTNNYSIYCSYCLCIWVKCYIRWTD